LRATDGAQHLSRRDSSKNFERYFIVPQIKSVGRGNRGAAVQVIDA